MFINRIKYGFSLLGRAVGKVLIAFIRIYQIAISPLFPDSCKFYPTCSSYSIQAIQKYGVIKGFFKAVYRILRCHPFSKGGYDPV